MTSELTILNLTGDGYGLKVTKEALELKTSILESAANIITVSNDAEMETARGSCRQLAKFRTMLESSRKSVKEPVLELGKKIDDAAKEFGAEVLTEENRIIGLGKAFATEQERIRREEAERMRKVAEEALKKAQEEARKIEAENRRVAQEAAAKARAEANAARVLQKNEDQERDDANRAMQARADAIRVAQENEARRIAVEQESARLSALAQAAAEATRFVAPAVAGTKIELDYEILNIHALYMAFPDAVELTPKRKVILEAIKMARAADPDACIHGIKITEQIKLNR